MPAHQDTTRNLGAAYPFIGEAGLGQRGVVIGDDILGGSFVSEPFEVSAAGVVSNPNMVGSPIDRSLATRPTPRPQVTASLIVSSRRRLGLYGRPGAWP
jgi:hypothetical protein